MGSTLDKIGMISAMICAVHCLAIPLLLMSGATYFSFIDHWIIDFFFISIGLLFIYFSIYRSYRNHKNRGPLVLSFLGLLMFLIAIIVNQSSLHFLFAIGGILWASSHFYNHRILGSLKNI